VKKKYRYTAPHVSTENQRAEFLNVLVDFKAELPGKPGKGVSKKWSAKIAAARRQTGLKKGGPFKDNLSDALNYFARASGLVREKEAWEKDNQKSSKSSSQSSATLLVHHLASFIHRRNFPGVD